MQLILKLSYLRFKLCNYLGIFAHMVLDIMNVSLDVSFYVLGSIRIFQSIMSIFIRSTPWTHVCYHNCSTVSTKTIF